MGIESSTSGFSIFVLEAKKINIFLVNTEKKLLDTLQILHVDILNQFL